MPTEAMTRFVAFPESAVATAQHGLANLCRAWTQVALGMIAAGNAELKVAQSICAVTPSAWQPILHPESAQAAARLWLRDFESRYRAAAEAQLQANKELASALLGASETILEALACRDPAAADDRPAEGERLDAERTTGEAAQTTGDAAATTGEAARKTGDVAQMTVAAAETTGDGTGDAARATVDVAETTGDQTKEPRAARAPRRALRPPMPEEVHHVPADRSL